MESNGFKVKIIIDTMEETEKELKSYEEARMYAHEINNKGMSSIGAVPINKKDKTA